MEKPHHYSELVVVNEYHIPQHPLHYRDESGELQLGTTCPSQSARPRRILEDPSNEGDFWLIGYASCTNPECNLSVPLTIDEDGTVSAGFSAFAGFPVSQL